MGKRAIIMAAAQAAFPAISGAGARSPWLEHSLAGRPLGH